MNRALSYLLLVRWWLYDLNSGDLLVATKMADCNLLRHLRETNVPLSRRLQHGRQLILAIRLLHDSGICHGDLRPETILVSEDLLTIPSTRFNHLPVIQLASDFTHKTRF